RDREGRRAKRPDSWSPLSGEPLPDPREQDAPRPTKRAPHDEAARGGKPARFKDKSFKDKSFNDKGFKARGEESFEGDFKAKPFKKDGFKAGKAKGDKPAYVSKARRADPSAKNPPFKKKAKKKFR
ncbi:DEAD/DEAH box helicase, partial [Rhodopseudomonas sp. BR0C11]|nr:DEAD/DEAH box helicase [Rhodopseudomonas sp. BR0C11]